MPMCFKQLNCVIMFWLCSLNIEVLVDVIYLFQINVLGSYFSISLRYVLHCNDALQWNTLFCGGVYMQDGVYGLTV